MAYPIFFKKMSLKRRFSKYVSSYVNPKNVKRARTAIAAAKSGRRIIKTAKRYIKKKQAKTKGVFRTQLREIGGDIGIHTSKQIYVQNNKPPNKTNASKYWHTFEQASTFSYASSAGTVPGTNQLNRQKVFDIAGYGYGSSFQSLSNSIINSSTAAYVGLNNISVPSQVSGSLIYQGVKGSFEFTNQEQANLLMTIYMCVANGNFPTFVAPADAWEASIDETAGNARTSANVANHMPDSKPTGDYFKSRWRIVKTTKIMMAAGVTQKHYFSHVVNKEIKLSDCINYEVHKNVSVGFLVCMRGTPVDFDAVQTHGPATLIGYAPSKIVGVTQLKYTFKTIPIENPKITYQNNAISGTAPTAVWELNDEDGKPVNIFAAAQAA